MFGPHLATLLIGVLLHFWSPYGVMNAWAQTDGVVVTTDVSYGAGPRHTLDIYAPPLAAAPAPIVVFFYGGGWASGNKAMYRFVGATLAAQGILTIIPDYRLHPEVRFPAFMEDAAAAVGWAHAQGARLGGDASRIFLMGHSAGGQIAALLALDPNYLDAVSMAPRDLGGVIGLAGAYDFVPAEPAAFAAIFGPEADWPNSRPVNHVTGGAPPMLLLAGGLDATVEPGNTRRLAARLRAAGGRVREVVFPDMSHMAMVAALSAPLAFIAPLRAEIRHFVEARETGRAKVTD